jgi:hypothetical protein
MDKTSFIIETYSDYIARTLGNLEKDKLARIRISTMNLFARNNTLMHSFLSAMSLANQKYPGDFLVYYDSAYTHRMLVMPDGHYIFPHSPWDIGKGQRKVLARQVRTQNLQEFANVLVDLPRRFYQIPTEAGFWRRLRSSHLLQRLATQHIKTSVARYRDGRVETAIQTGELSSASTQNNLSLTILDNEKAAKFIETIINPQTKISRGFAVKPIAPNLELIADYGNYGQPGQISHIHELAEKMINPGKKTPRPTNVILVSQYIPSGRILKALKFAANPNNYGARVIIPLEPADDYRRNEIGFKILNHYFQLRRGKHLLTPVRPVPSHSKCLIVKYANDSLAMIFGSDNFDSTSDNFYRNTELSLRVDRVKKGENGYDMIVSMLHKLVEEQEIKQSELDKLL